MPDSSWSAGRASACAHTPTPTHDCKTNGHNAGSECQIPRQLDGQTRQSRLNANGRLSAVQSTERKHPGPMVGEAVQPLAAALWQQQHPHTIVVYHPVQYKRCVYTWSMCQSNLQILQRNLQRKPGPDTITHNTQTGHIQRLVLRAHYNLGSAKSSLFH